MIFRQGFFLLRSAGVSGRLGKTENCQTGVFGCLGRGERATLTDFRLFLPETRASDKDWCEKAKVPEHQRRHRTRTELAMEMVMRARGRELTVRNGGKISLGTDK